MAYNKETGMYEGFIYKITNTINGKIYIGQTARTLNERYAHHKCSALTQNKILPLYNSMRKYGEENFNLDVLEKLEFSNKDILNKSLDDKEIYYISQYNSRIPNGYNITLGGDGVRDVNCRQIFSYDPYTKIVQNYDSIKDAFDMTGVPASNIIRCCNKGIKHAGNLIFRYIEDEITNDDIERYFNACPIICQYDAYGKLINKFNSTYDAAYFLSKELGKDISSHYINDSCEKDGTCFGYIWRKNNEPFNKYGFNTNYIRDTKIGTEELVDVYTLKGELVLSGKTVRKSLDELNLKDKSTFSPIRCCRKYSNTAYGYVWRFHHDEFGTIIKENKSNTKKKIYEYLLDGSIVNIYNKMADVVSALNVSMTRAQTLVRYHNIFKNGHSLFYEGDEFSIDRLVENDFRVNAYTLDGEFIATYENAGIAARETNSESSSIIKCCRKKIKSHNSMRWFNIYDETQPNQDVVVKKLIA